MEVLKKGCPFNFNTLDKQTSIPEGSHLVKDDQAPLPNPKLGHISASCWSVEYDNPFSLVYNHA